MELTSLYAYYEQETIAPTFADLRDETAVTAYGRQRERLLSERLALPMSFFRGAEVLEFGPDTGENALTFARWGARLTLVEPVPAAHAAIATYFERFAPPGALGELVVDDVLGFVPLRRYDIVVAEGFIYTVQPASRWLAAFSRALVPGGLALISYIEARASLFELLMRVPFGALRRREGIDREAAAQRLYRRKWDRIPHTRAFSSWAMDVLDNPFMRNAYFLRASDVVTASATAGFGIHAAWPLYRDGLENAWAKRPLTAAETVARTVRHLQRSVLTLLFGTKAFLIDEAAGARLEALVDSALIDADGLIERDDAAIARRLAATLRQIGASATAEHVIADDRSLIASGVALLRAWADVVELIAADRLNEAEIRLNVDDVLLDGWGSPTHLAVLRSDTSAP